MIEIVMSSATHHQDNLPFTGGGVERGRPPGNALILERQYRQEKEHCPLSIRCHYKLWLFMLACYSLTGMILKAISACHSAQCSRFSEVK
jgi:hypothetical protein